MTGLPRIDGDAVAEHHAVRERAGLADLSARALWRVSGADRVKYLQGILTNDIAALSPGQGCYAALLDVKGHLQADLHVYATDDALLIDLAPSIAEQTIALLKRYIVIYKVKLEPLAGWLHLLLSGPKSDAWLSAVFGRPLPVLVDQQFVTWDWQGQPVMLIRRSETGEAGVHLLAPPAIANALRNALSESGRPFGARSIGAQALETLRIEAGVPSYESEMAGARFPAEVGIEQAISYTKGCYLGQETTMRIKTQGAVNRKLVGLFLEGAVLPEPGAPLFSEGQKIGQVTSAIESPTLKRRIALGYAQKGSFAPGTPLTLADGSRALVAELPFYRRA